VGKKLSATVAALASTLALASGAAAITNGQTDGSAHPNVGALYVLTPGGPFEICSGTLVAPGVFLTAAHCVDAPPPILKVTTFLISFAPVYDESSFIPAPGTNVVIDPAFAHQDQGDPHDIAVLRFDPNAARGIQPVKLPQLGFLDAFAASGKHDNGRHIGNRGSVVKLKHNASASAGNANGNNGNRKKPDKNSFVDVGYGITDISQLQQGSDGTRRFAISGDPQLDPSFLTLSQDASQGFGGTCVGDSGGPQFLGDVQVSITLGGDDNCTQFGVNLRLDTAAAQSFLASVGVR
jgi:secreted trypsin-like serine protease